VNRARAAGTLRRAGGQVLRLLAVLLIVSIGTFGLVEMIPGDPAQNFLGETSTPEEYERIRGELGLDRPVVTRYLDWLGGVLTGDLGKTLAQPVQPVSDVITAALPISLQLAVMAMTIALVISIPAAMLSARRPGGRLDRTIGVVTFSAVSIPSFLAAFLLILFFVRTWSFFPRVTWVRLTDDPMENLHHAFLPALSMAIVEIAVFTRLLRSDLISTLQESYVLAARARGMGRWEIMFKEVLRPSSFSLVTLAGVSLGRLIGSAVIVETVFGLPGIGRAIVGGAGQRNYTVVQGGVLVLAFIYVAVNAAIDVGYTRLDPRLRRRPT
jgi:peptide/nickel transport system permease protein